ncbi:hypothetical protein [Streptomyces sp. ST2-7A]|uniref:ABC transporter permease subunit n=1 Tax=Streptomyces sp. ST2-7A TaxID=2907214 RepID=UPI0027E33EE7|nr:hypothetical protein [Streptomyces sp. ST2-7A]
MRERGPAGCAEEFRREVRDGEPGATPVVVGPIVIAAAYGPAAVITSGYVPAPPLRERRRRPAHPAVQRDRGAPVAAAAFGVARALTPASRLPTAPVIFPVIPVLAEFVVRRTRYDRRIFAAGGNTEVARRAGSNVAGVRLTVFTIASSLAAPAGSSGPPGPAAPPRARARATR